MPDNEIGTNRLSKYKNQSRHEDARRRRAEVSVELRKARKDDQILKRRNINTDDLPANLSDQSPVKAMSIDEIIANIHSEDPEVVFQATRTCRKMLSREKNAPIDIIIEKGVVEKSIEFLTRDDSPNLQFEAAWILTNVASGTSEQTEVVIQQGAVPKLINLLNSKNSNVVEQAVWALGNIAGDGPYSRDYILSQNVMPLLIEIMKSPIPLSLTRNVIWTISNLCRNKNPMPDFEKIKPALSIIHRMLTLGDSEVLADSCWALSYLTDGPNEKIQACISEGIIPFLIEFLDSQNSNILTPTLRSVGNIATGTDAQTDEIIKHGVLPKLGKLLQHKRHNTVKEAAWTISNITAGSTEQIQQVIDAGLFPLLINVVKTGESKSQKEAAWALANVTAGGKIEQLALLVQLGALEALCSMLNSKDWRCVTTLLDSVSNILLAAQKIGEIDRVAMAIEECGGLDTIEALQGHENEQVYQKAAAIIDSFFSFEDQNVTSSTAPATEGDQFDFQVADFAPAQNKFNF